MSESSENKETIKTSPSLFSVGSKAAIFCISVLPIVAVFLMARSKLLRLIVAYLEMPLILSISFAGGVFWWRLLTGQISASSRATFDSDSISYRDQIFLLIVSIAMGFSIGIFLMELNTHEMVRAFWTAWPAHSEDD
jgi:hypothetical protein